MWRYVLSRQPSLILFNAPEDACDTCQTYFVWLTLCVCVSGPRHRRPGWDHFWDVQRGEEGFLPLGGSGSKQAAVRRLQTSSTNVRQQKPCRQVSVWRKDDREHNTTLFPSQFVMIYFVFPPWRYTPDEIEKLKAWVKLLWVLFLAFKCFWNVHLYVVFVSRLREKHGNDWATIGAALGRSASSVKDRCRLMKDTCNTGEEDQTESEILHLFTFIQYLK